MTMSSLWTWPGYRGPVADNIGSLAPRSRPQPRESAPSAEDWDELTLAPDKRRAFAPDIYFREGWADFEAVFGKDARAIVGRLALLSFKPEAVPGRRMIPTLEFVLANGLVPVAVAEVAYTRHSMRELWRYDWDIHPVDRLMLATTMHTSGPTLLWLLRDVETTDYVPTTVRLRGLRGAAAEHERRPGELRTMLAPPNRIVNFVHVADEPADLVRELGIFLGRAERRAILHHVKAGWPGDDRDAARDAVRRLEQKMESHDFDFEQSVHRLAASGALGADDVARLRHGTSEPLSWEDLCTIVDPVDPEVSVWDFISVACEVLPDLQEGTRNLVASAGLERWRARGLMPDRTES
jgi:hypothetical protein